MPSLKTYNLVLWNYKLNYRASICKSCNNDRIQITQDAACTSYFIHCPKCKVAGITGKTREEAVNLWNTLQLMF